jgi:peptide subunit release factor 1 (eRF1)
MKHDMRIKYKCSKCGKVFTKKCTDKEYWREKYKKYFEEDTYEASSFGLNAKIICDDCYRKQKKIGHE